MTEAAPILEWQDSQVIFQQNSAQGVLLVRENKHYRWLDFGNEYTQTAMQIAHSERLVLQYTQAMTLAYALNPGCQNILNLGAGCGAFERFFSRHFAKIDITSVEADPVIADIAQRFFELPEQHSFHLEAAQSFVQKDSSAADIVFCDLHNGDKNPNCLQDPTFYSDTRRCMAADGVLVLNLVPRNEQDLKSALTALRRVFKWQYLLEFQNIANILVFATAQRPKAKSQLKEQASKLGEQTGIDHSDSIRRLRLLPEAL